MLRVHAPAGTESRLLVCGVVERGDRRGSQLGFPTANISLDSVTITPPEGVYAGYAHGDRTCHQAAISVGRRPTFYRRDGDLLLEAHLLDFDGELDGETLVVELVAPLRAQLRFDGPDGLREQLARDVERTRDVLSAFRPTVGPVSVGPG